YTRARCQESRKAIDLGAFSPGGPVSLPMLLLLRPPQRPARAAKRAANGTDWCLGAVLGSAKPIALSSCQYSCQFRGAVPVAPPYPSVRGRHREGPPPRPRYRVLGAPSDRG